MKIERKPNLAQTTLICCRIVLYPSTDSKTITYHLRFLITASLIMSFSDFFSVIKDVPTLLALKKGVKTSSWEYER